MSDLRERVQADHVADASGYCQECREDTRWPCELSWIAATAETIGTTGSPAPAEVSVPSPRSTN